MTDLFIITISHEQNPFVVAEGVTTARQRDALVALGCDAFQGLPVSRPLPVGRSITGLPSKRR